jgi:hypothetical protein
MHLPLSQNVQVFAKKSISLNAVKMCQTFVNTLNSFHDPISQTYLPYLYQVNS